MRVIQTHLLSCLFFFALAPHATASSAHAPVADLMRLSGYAEGPISAVGPGLDVAAGAVGAKALGDRGCDSQGMPYRELVHARVNLEIASVGARRLDLIIRSVNQAREIALTLDGEPLGSSELDGSWQRISFRTQALSAGPHKLAFTMTPTGSALSDPHGEDVLALLHSVRLSSTITPPSGDPVATFKGADTLWLEAGETIRIPAPPLPDHALRTAGTHARGVYEDLSVQVAFQTLEGAIDSRLVMPAGLSLPWNLSLGASGDRTARYLRISALGTSTGAVGLIRPELTRPLPRPLADGAQSTERLIVIAIPGLRSDDARDAISSMKEWASADVWSSADATGPALASLFTGRYAEAHGLIARGDTLSPELKTLASISAAAGRKTILRGGHLAQATDKALWSGYSDAQFADSKAFKHTAEGVLGALSVALNANGDSPVFASAVLGDVLPPYLPRAEAWRAHWPKDKSLPWNPREGRTEVQRQRSAKKGPSPKEQAFWRALRRGKIDEVFTALKTFVAGLKGPTSTRVVVIGLGGPSGAFAAGPPALESLRAPILVNDLSREVVPNAASDLSDVHATLANWAGAANNPTPGQRFDRPSHAPWHDLAFATIADRWEVAVDSERALLLDRQGGTTQVLTPSSDGSNWVRQEDTGPTALLETTLHARRLRAKRCAGTQWSRADYSPAAAPGRPSGAGELCER